MSQSIIGASAPIVSISNNTVVTTSVAVAGAFGRPHKDVLHSIAGLLAVLSGEHKRNFSPMFVDVEIGNGAVRKSTAYEITRDGFTLLAMGFTGSRALQFKLAYIDAFNAMESQLHAGTADAQRELSRLRAELVAGSPVYSRLARYHAAGLNSAEIGTLMGMHRTTVGVHLRKMAHLGLIDYTAKRGRPSLPSSAAQLTLGV